MRLNIELIQTEVKQWGTHAGIQQYVKHLSSNLFKCRIHFSKDGNKLSNPSNRLNRLLRFYTKKNGSDWYGLFDFITELKLLRHCLVKKPVIIHYLSGEHGLHFLPHITSLPFFKHIKTIATFHQPPELLDELINYSSIRKLDHVILVSPTQVNYFEQYLPSEKISVVLHGIDTEFFTPAKKTTIKSSIFRCTTVGYWLRDWHAITCVTELLVNFSNIEFHIVHKGQLALPNNTYVTQHAVLTDDQLLALYQSSDVLLLPLTGSTANNSLLEGIACGLPIISTDLPAVRAYLSGKESILIKDNTPEEIVAAILKLQHEPHTKITMGQKAREQAETINWENTSTKYSELYAKL